MKVQSLKWACILSLTTAFSSIALSHPSDSSYMDQIPVGSRLVFNRDINILPGDLEVSLGQFSHANDRLESCKIKIEASDRDRVIESGSVLILRERIVKNSNASGYSYNFGKAETEFISKKDLKNGQNKIKKMRILNLVCLFKPSFFDFIVYSSETTTIGEFKQLLNGTADLEIAPPEEF